MRALLFALVGFGLACAIGILLLGTPSPVADAVAMEAGQVPRHAGFGAWWIVVLCWLTVLVTRPRWLTATLTIVVLITGACAIVLGVAGEFWSHATASPETGGKTLLAGGVLILLAPVAGLLRTRSRK